MSAEVRSLQNSIVRIERITIVLTVLAQIGWAVYQVHFQAVGLLSFAFLAVSFSLSGVAPKATRGRLILLLAQAVAISAACAFGAHRLYSINFLVLGAKAAVLLPVTEMVTVAVVLLLGRAIAGAVSIYLLQHVFHGRAMPEFYATVVQEVETKIDFLIGLITVLFLGHTVVSERQSRDAQQLLAQEAEQLLVDYERENISQDIHDSVGHILASLMIQLELGIRLLDENKLEEAKETVSHSLDSAMKCLQELRRAVSAIRTQEKGNYTGDQTETKPLHRES